MQFASSSGAFNEFYGDFKFVIGSIRSFWTFRIYCFYCVKVVITVAVAVLATLA